MASVINIVNEIVYKGYTIRHFREQQTGPDSFDVFYWVTINDKDDKRVDTECKTLIQTIDEAKEFIDALEGKLLKFRVFIPVQRFGVAYAVVEASNEEEALEKGADEAYGSNLEWEVEWGELEVIEDMLEAIPLEDEE